MKGPLWRRVLMAALAPLVVLAGALGLLAATRDGGLQTLIVVQWAPLTLAALGLPVALHFNRSRAFFAILTLVAAALALDHGAATSGFSGYAIYDAVCVFLPLNLMIFALITERGVFTRAGSFRFLIVFLQGVFVAIVVWSQSEKLAWVLQAPVFESALTRALEIAPPGLLMALIALLLFHGRLVLDPTPERAAFFGASIAAVFALYDGYQSPWTGTLLGAAGLMFMVSLLQTSWRMAFLDELTGVPGRRALEEQLVKLDDQYVIAMIDIDHFKRFNDTWGHEAGDEVLRMVAARLVGVGAGGRVYRYGGEEFTVVFPHKSMRETLAALGALRKDIADETFVIRKRDRRVGDPRAGTAKVDDDREVNITISIGAAEAGRGGDTPNEVMRSADKALYRAKKNGRNQVSR